MNFRPTKFYLLLFYVLLLNCNVQKKQLTKDQFKLIPQNWFNGKTLLDRVKILSSDEYEGRETGSNGAKKAKDFIVSELRNLAVLPLAPNYIQPFSFKKSNTSYRGENILSIIKGSIYPEKYIVLSAHYDHEGIKNGEIYNGADDNASGISALITFANFLKKNPPKHSVIFAAFDAEELGLIGSKYFVDNTIIPLNSIKLNLNMDMIGRSDTSELYIIGTNHYKQLQSVIPEKSLGLQIISDEHDGIGKGINWTNSSDHASFHSKGIPFLYFGVEDHKDYHQPTDDYEGIQPIFYQNSVYTAISIFKKLDGMQL